MTLLKNRWLAAAFAAVVILACRWAAAQEKPADPPKDEADRSLREQDIYIPYEKLRQVFEKHGRGVFLPYEKFDELWKAAQDKNRPAAEPRPPVGAVITEIENEAVVAKDVVEVKAKIKIDLLAEGWHEVPLRLADAALVKATIRGEPARILGGAGQDHRLLVEKKGKQPEQVELSLEYARAISRTPGQNSVAFQAPQAPVSRWKVRIPQAGVKVNLQPLIAATEVPPEEKPGEKKIGEKNIEGKKPEDSKKPGETVILAFVGAAPSVQIDWTPKAEGATGMTALASVQTEQRVWIQEGMTRSQASLVYSISRAELKELAVEAPSDFKVVNIFDPGGNIQQWAVEPAAAGATVQKVTARLFEPAKATQTIVVELEKILGGKRQELVKAPVVKALNVGRQQGFVVAQVSSGLRAEAGRTSGVLQVDAGELPAALRGNAWAFAYRYAAVPFEVELNVEEVQPRITAESLLEARLEPEKLTLDLTAVYTIERAGVFKLELDVPEGFEVRNVKGRAVNVAAGACAAAEVDSHHLEGEKKTHLVVNLSRKALGRVALGVQLQREIHDANLLTPTGKAATIELPIPQVSKGSVERATGHLVIQAPESLTVNPVNAAKIDGLRAVSSDEALEGMAAAVAPKAAGQGDVRTVLAYLFTQEPTKMTLSAERRKPYVTISQTLVGHIEEGVVKYEATFKFNVQYSGVKSLRIDVPADIAANIHLTTQNLRKAAIDPPPADVAKEMVAWEFSGLGELFGEGQIALNWESKLDKLEVGKSTTVVVPRLIPRGVDRADGFIVLAKAESLDFQEADDAKGLLPIDPQHELPTPVAGAARAFKFQDDWSLPLNVTRYELEEIKRTSIDRGVARMVVTPAGEISVQAVYRVRTARPRLNFDLPAGSSIDRDPFRINGQAVAEQQSGKEEKSYSLSLQTASADEPFVFEVRYTMPRGSPLELPHFADDTAVQKIHLCAYVPAADDLLGSTGPWSEEYQWGWSYPNGRWLPISNLQPDALVQSVCQGNGPALNAAQTFHTDGTVYVFSTLRPDNKVALELKTADHRTLVGVVFGIVLLGGALLVMTGLARRVLAVAGFIVALVLMGVFLPTLSLQVRNWTLSAAVTIVLLFWLVVFVFRSRGAAVAAWQGLATCWRNWTAPKPLPAVPVATPAVEVVHEQPKTEGGQP